MNKNAIYHALKVRSEDDIHTLLSNEIYYLGDPASPIYPPEEIDAIIEQNILEEVEFDDGSRGFEFNSDLVSRYYYTFLEALQYSVDRKMMEESLDQLSALYQDNVNILKVKTQELLSDLDDKIHKGFFAIRKDELKLKYLILFSFNIGSARRFNSNPTASYFTNSMGFSDFVEQEFYCRSHEVIMTQNNQLNFDSDEVKIDVANTVGKKIIFLDELGIINFINQEYDLKDNSRELAKIISVFIGEKSETVRPLLNTIIKPMGYRNKNYPYNSKNESWLLNTMSFLGLKMKKNK